MGTMFDNTGSYQLALTILIPVTVIGAGLMLPLGRWSGEVRMKSAELQAQG